MTSTVSPTTATTEPATPGGDHAPPRPFDLLVRAEHALDPGTGLDGPLEIGIVDGRIAAVGPQLDATGAGRVVEFTGANRYVVPGLIDIHTHVAHGAVTDGLGMACCDPDVVGIGSGVTTVVDCGSVGVANVGVFPAHITPRAKTRVIVYVNAGRYAHTMPYPDDFRSLDDLDDAGIDRCIERNPGLVEGIKLRLTGQLVSDAGETVVDRAVQMARRSGVPLMVHVGDMFAHRRANPERMSEVTRHLLGAFAPGDILTHLCTPNAGGVADSTDTTWALVNEARARGVILDPALGMGNFGYRIAQEQADRGLRPDTISSDVTGYGQTFHSLVECMSKFMAVGYTLSDVVAMTTGRAAAAIGRSADLGAIAVGREADLTVLDVVDGDFVFTDTVKETFRGTRGLVPVQTLRAGETVAPWWGPHPWGWLPAPADPAEAR